MPSPADAAPLTPAMRALLYAAAGLVFLAGVQLFVFPLRTADYFAWTIDAPMTAVFLGAAYWSSVALEVTAARVASWAQARVAVLTVFVFTVLTFGVTLLHLDLFHLGPEHSASTRAVTWGWLAVYTLVPVAMVVVAVAQSRRTAPTQRPGASLPPGLQRTLVVLAVVLLGVGVFLLLAPEQASGWWPWPLTPLTGRAVGAWLVGLGVAAVHARVVNDVAAVRPLGITGVAFFLLQTVALVRHGGDLDWAGLPAAGFVAGLLLVGGAGAWILRSTAAPSALQPR